MSRDIFVGVAFDPSAGTLDFTGVTGFDPRRLRTVIRQASNTPLFLLGGGSALGGTWTGLVLKLNAPTLGMGALDALTITISDERVRFFNDVQNQSIAVNQLFLSTRRDVGDNTAFTNFTVEIFSSQAGTLQIFQSQDANGNVTFVTDTTPVSAGGFARLSAPIVCRWVQAVFANQATAGTINLSSSLRS